MSNKCLNVTNFLNVKIHSVYNFLLLVVVLVVLVGLVIVVVVVVVLVEVLYSLSKVNNYIYKTIHLITVDVR